MSLFTVTEYDKQVYNEQIRDFLPPKIIDIHTHIWLDKLLTPEPLKPGEVKRTVSWPALVAKDNSIEDLMETYRLMFPDKEVLPMVFSNANRASLKVCNDYVRQSAARMNVPALY